jgi:hypothetical protein
MVLPTSRFTWLGGERHRVLPLLLLALTAGCISEHAKYPENWAPPEQPATSAAGKNEPAACPNLAGRYSIDGTLADGTPAGLCDPGTKYRRVGDWRCETSLSVNIGSLEAGGNWVELQQPDSDTLVVVPGDSTVYPKTLHRSKGDFDCTQGGLVRRSSNSSYDLGEEDEEQSAFQRAYNAVGTASGLFLGMAGVKTLTRTFSRASDGAIVMHVQRADRGLVLAIPYKDDESTYVRWLADSSTPIEPGAPAPSARVANVRPYRAHALGTVWLVSVDGAPDDDAELIRRFIETQDIATFWDIPQSVDPGSHWIEFHPRYYPQRRFGATMELVAGHTYRLARSPPDCEARSAKSKETSPHQLWTVDLVMEDTTPGSAPTQFRVPALCGMETQHCEQDAHCADGACVRFPGARSGFCGVEPPH